VNKYIFSLCIAVCAVLIIGCPKARRVQQQSIDEVTTQIGQPTFFVDWAGFKGKDSTTSRLEIYYQVFHFGLQFKKIDALYKAYYTFAITITDPNGRQIYAQEQERNITVAEYWKTTSRFDYRISQFNCDLQPGNYTVMCRLTDESNKNITNRNFKITLKSFKNSNPIASNIQFVQAVNGNDSGMTVFSKGDLSVIPSPSRYFGGDDSSKLLYYFEIYPGESNTDQVKVETVIRSLIRGFFYRDTMSVSLKSDMVRQLRDISIDSWHPGEYEMEVTLLGRRNKQLDQHKESFTIQWSQEGLLKHDFKTALEQLEYIAPSSEIKKMKNLKTIEERMAAFNAFWDSRDPTLGTKDNEAKREFYRRVTYANKQFSHLRREGWRTDRGRIYIQYGEPDQIDDVPMSLDAPPYQIWHYYQQGTYRRFTFLDRNEDGDYRLQFPYDGTGKTPDF
jgi:GWxTD domain-containing protein